MTAGANRSSTTARPRRSRAGALAAFVALGLLPACDETPAEPDLAASCSASPSSGAAPLAVAFTLNVTGADQFDVEVNYGDGTSSPVLNLAHVYHAAGGFTATFTVRAGSRSAACSTGVNVTGAPVGPGPTPSPSATPGANRPPNPVYRTTPRPGPGDVFMGQAPLSIEFSMCASSDVDLDVLLWTMDFEGDGRTEVRGSTGGSCRRTNAYAAGSYRPEICVTDLDRAGQPRHDFQCKRYTVQVTP
jgi:hypothetical protein